MSRMRFVVFVRNFARLSWTSRGWMRSRRSRVVSRHSARLFLRHTRSVYRRSWEGGPNLSSTLTSSIFEATCVHECTLWTCRSSAGSQTRPSCICVGFTRLTCPTEKGDHNGCVLRASAWDPRAQHGQLQSDDHHGRGLCAPARDPEARQERMQPVITDAAFVQL